MTKNVRIVEWGLSIGLNGCTREHEMPLADSIDKKEYDNLSVEKQQK